MVTVSDMAGLVVVATVDGVVDVSGKETSAGDCGCRKLYRRLAIVIFVPVATRP